MEVKIKASCMYCGKKEKTVVEKDTISSYMRIMNVKWGYVCNSCSNKVKDIAKSKMKMSNKELYKNIKDLVDGSGMICTLFNRKVNLGIKGKENARSIKYAHIIDPCRESYNPLISVYYDVDGVLGSVMNSVPYYEIYCGGGVERYIQGQEDKVLEEIRDYVAKYIEKNKR